MRNLKSGILVIFILTVFSCQPVLKKVLGIKTPQVELKNSERMVYYEPFTKVKSNLKIYSVSDTTSLKLAYRNFTDYPHVIAHDVLSNNKYRIHCYDDVSGQIEDINNGNLKLLTEIPDSIFVKTKIYFEKHSELVFGRTENKIGGKWNIYIVSGVFLGEKLRNRTVAVTELNDINSFEILDLSVNAIEQ